MNDPEIYELEEARLDEVTGGGKGIPPFDSGKTPTTPAANNVFFNTQPGKQPPAKSMGDALDKINEDASNGKQSRAMIDGKGNYRISTRPAR